MTAVLNALAVAATLAMVLVVLMGALGLVNVGFAVARWLNARRDDASVRSFSIFRRDVRRAVR